jgi:hypothetical protein
MSASSIHTRATRRLLSALVLASVGLSLSAARPAAAQTPINGVGFVSSAPGVYLDLDGTVRRRQVDVKDELATMKARAKAAAEAGKAERLCFVSLPKTFAQAQALTEAGKPLPEELKYLGGLTQIRYVFVFPEEKDLVIAGPAEPWFVIDEQHAAGKRSGRAVMRLEDLVVAMRTVRDIGPGVFGCALDPDPGSLKAAEDVMVRMANRSRAERMQEITRAMGPQKVRIFGTAPDTRFAFACVAADYELKRYALGLAHSPLPNLGNGQDSSRSAANKWWFCLAYDPILVAPDGNAYGLRGPRLGVKAGGFDFDPRGATEKAIAFAKRMSQNIEALAAAQPLFSDLQNLADLTVAAALIDRDRLDRRAKWDSSWLYDEKACPVTRIPVPKTAETIANFTNGSIAAGGVVMTPARTMTDTPREKDEKGVLAGPREQAGKLRQADKEGRAVVQ